MTPQERQLVDDLFDRLSRVENAPREPDAEAAIMQGLRRAPNAVYALVQTVLVQDEALKHAEARIQELEGGSQPQQPSGGFLDSMRDTILGQGRGSVPSIRPGEQRGGPVWNSGQALGQADTRYGGDPRMNDPRSDPRTGNPGGGVFGGGGGSFLGTAAATAAGVIGGSMLMNSIRGMMGGGSQQSFGNTAESGGARCRGATISRQAASPAMPVSTCRQKRQRRQSAPEFLRSGAGRCRSGSGPRSG